MLRGNLRRRRHRRQRLDALAGDRHHQPQTVIAHRLLPVGVAKYLAKRLDIGSKSGFTPPTGCPVHPGPPTDQAMGLHTTFCGSHVAQYFIELFVTQ
jgi:hypothetical protein